MSTPPAGISEADWESWPAGARELILSQHEEIELLRSQLTALASELASLRERIGRSSRNSSKPPSSDGLGFKPLERRKGSGLLGSAFPLSFSKTQALLQQLVGVEMSSGAIARVRQRLSSALEQPMQEVLAFARVQPVAYVDETGAPTGNADGNNPTGKRGWQWVMVTAVVTVFVQGLSRSTAAAIELLGNAFGGIVVSDRFSAYNHLPIKQRPDASAEFGAQLLGLQQQLFGHWHHYKEGKIDWPALQQSCRPIHQAFETTLQQLVELGYQRGERTPRASTVRTCQQLQKLTDGLWTFLENEGIEPTNNAAERALRQSVIQRKISHGVQSASGAICRSRLLTVTTTLRSLRKNRLNGRAFSS